MKKLAAAFHDKTAKMMRPADAERLTGNHVGGISPFAQKQWVAIVIDEGGHDAGKRIREWRSAWFADRARTKRCP
jgi:prolyl-tRNA editing enzyme YbaK/EbsC (Cys-tRNA(Pro) deacylase)